jgi:hypothetical protein
VGSRIKPDRGLVSDGLQSFAEPFLPSPERREDVRWPEFELKDFRELGLDLLKNLPHFVRVLD